MFTAKRIPIPGDRVEVVLSAGDVLCRGILIAQENTMCFVHCDAAYGADERVGTYRADQVRCEPSAAGRLETIIRRLGNRPKPTQRRPTPWFRFRPLRPQPEQTDQEMIDVATGLGIVELLKPLTVPNVADQIVTETADGLRRNDPVIIQIRERNDSGTGRFIAEFRGKRHVIFKSGGAGAYPAEDVTKA